MEINYTENEKRHVLESSTGFVATYLKVQLTKEEAEQAFELSLKMLGITTKEVEPETPRLVERGQDDGN